MQEVKYNVKLRSAGRTAYIVVDGPLNEPLPKTDELAANLQRKGQRFAILDLKHNDEIDKDGLHWLSDLQNSLTKKDVDLKIVVGERSNIQKMLKLTQYDRFLSIVTSLVQAWKHRKSR